MAGAMPAVCNRGILEKRRGRVYNGHVQKKKEDERVEKRITPDELADMLMRRVYVPFSAVSAVNGRGEILSLCQFDTAFADQTIAFEKSAEEIWLLSNHPEGVCEMTEEDETNLRRLRRDVGQARVRFFLVGEDTGCVEVEIGRKA